MNSEDQENLEKDLGINFDQEAIPNQNTNNFEVADLIHDNLDTFNNPGTQGSNAFNLQTHIKNIDSIFEPEPEEHAFPQ